MQSKAIELSVGAFMLAGLLSLAILAVKVSGFNVGSDTETYPIYARFENIGGLSVRAKVTIAGVVVGRVAEIVLDKDEFTAVVRLEVHSDVDNLTTDTTAAILTEGLLGGKYVGLVTGAEDEMMTAGDSIEDTQSALVLEEMIGEFLLNAVKE